jgi:adenylyl- and sulfurtransferase ThiI
MIEERNTFIVRCGEVALKGLNKPYFERMLVDRIKRSLKKHVGVEVKRKEGLIFVRAQKELDSDLIIAVISWVFGVASMDPHRMTIVESWASQADLDRHMAQDWFKVWRPKLDAAVRIPINGRRHNATAEPGTSQS